MATQENTGWSPRRKRWTWGSVLSAAAAIATILGFLTSGHSSSTPQPSQTAASYPVNVQSNFLNGCEENATPVSCQCMLNWFENNVSLPSFVSDDQQASEGITTPDMSNAVNACTVGG